MKTPLRRMRFLILLTLATLSLFSFAKPSLAQNAAAKEPRKLALLVGISDYNRGRNAETDWWNLHCEGDIATMKQVLVERFGFAEKDILVLTDAKATRQGIIDAFQNQLISKARPGDVVLFHYSGHGQQVPDPTKRKLNGMNQGFVLYDYISQRAADGAKSNLLDTQMRDLLGQLKSKMLGGDGKVAGNITVFLDSCFSGTATRGASGLPHRGRGWNEKLDGPLPQAAKVEEAPTGSGLLGKGETTAQGYVVISATRSDQTAQESRDERGRPMGALISSLAPWRNPLRKPPIARSSRKSACKSRTNFPIRTHKSRANPISFSSREWPCRNRLTSW